MRPCCGPAGSGGSGFEVVTGAEARRRLPQHLIRDGDVALFDPEGGYVLSERAVFSAVQLAQRRGASFLGDRKVTALEHDRDRWLVRTDQEEVRAPRVLVATGTGAGPVCAALGTHLAVLPQVLTWFPIADPGLPIAASSTSSSAARMMLSSTASPVPTDGP